MGLSRIQSESLSDMTRNPGLFLQLQSVQEMCLLYLVKEKLVTDVIAWNF